MAATFEEWTHHLFHCQRCYDASKLAIRDPDRWQSAVWITGSCDKGKELSKSLPTLGEKDG